MIYDLRSENGRKRREDAGEWNCGLRIEDSVAAGPSRPQPAASGLRGPVVQTNPIPIVVAIRGSVFSGGAIVPNKANWRWVE